MLIRYLDKSLLLKFCLLLTGFFVLGYFTTIAFYIVMVGALALALCGGSYSIIGLSLYTIVKCLNSGIYHFPPEFGAFAWIVLLSSAARNIIFLRPSAWKILTPLLIFSLITALLSAISSSHPSVSFMKLISFVIGVSTVIAAYSMCTKNDVIRLQHWIIALYIVVILFSVFTIAQPKYAYLVNGVGFQGVLNQPQTFGALLSPLLAWLLAIIGFGRVKVFSYYSVIAVVLIGLIVMSQTRTALVAVLLTLITLFLIFLLNHGKYKTWGSIKKISINIAILTTVLIVAFTISAGLRDMATGFVYKRGSTNIEKAVSSRSGGYEGQFNNFKERPLLGHGFGVYPGEKSTKDVVTFMGIPISAPVEKGFILTALLEETGIIGTLLFFALIISISKRSLKTQNLGWIAVFFTCLFVNIGEAVFFSVGGIGLFYWILIGLSSYEYKLNIIHNEVQNTPS